MQISKLFHWKATPTRAFNEFLYEFLRIFFNFGKFVKIREFFLLRLRISMVKMRRNTINESKLINYHVLMERINVHNLYAITHEVRYIRSPAIAPVA